MKRTILVFVSGVAFCHGVFAREHIIEAVTENIQEARGQEFKGSKGGPKNNKLTNADSPVRDGKTAFKHWVSQKGERSELAMSRTEIGGIYWYGWSMYLPKEFDHRGSNTIVMQLATWPTPRNGKFPCSANGPYMHIQANGKLVFHLQHKGDKNDMVCDHYVLVKDVSPLKEKWIDFVMQAKWTGNKDGFFKFWMRAGDKSYEQKIDYKGRTWWNDEGKGPYFKMGAYMGDPGWKGPESRTVFTDEYRLGDANASFSDVAPSAQTERRNQKGGHR